MGKHHQKILIDKNGFIVDSDDFLFKAKLINGNSVKQIFPLIESIFNVIMKLSTNDDPLVIPSVTTSTDFLPGIYNYSFWRFNATHILWEIEDSTAEYLKIQRIMQVYNDKMIAKEQRNS